MAVKPICCPDCNSSKVVKHGTSEAGKRRYRCKNPKCKTSTFILDYTYNACVPGIKQMILDMTMNGSGIRDISRVLSISKDTVLSEIKKISADVHLVNFKALESIGSNDKVRLERVEDAELDEM